MIKISWQYGDQVHFGKFGGVVKNLDAVKYVCKYITKNVDYVDLNNLGSSYNYMHTIHKEDKTFIPFHLESLYFGASLSSRISESDYIRGKVRLPIPNEKNSDPYTDYPIPLYILRKNLYEIYKNSNNTISYRLTPFGADIKAKQIKELFKEFENRFDVFRKNFFKVKYSFEFNNNVLNLVYDSLHNVDLFNLFLYRIVIRNSCDCCFIPSSLDDFQFYYNEKFNTDVPVGLDRTNIYFEADFDLFLFYFEYFWNSYYYNDYEQRITNYNSLQYYRFSIHQYDKIFLESAISIEEYLSYYNKDSYEAIKSFSHFNI